MVGIRVLTFVVMSLTAQPRQAVDDLYTTVPLIMHIKTEEPAFTALYFDENKLFNLK